MPELDPYAGLSPDVRATCVDRMARTLARKPSNRKTRTYVNSLTGATETPEQFRARCRAAAEKVIAAPSSAAMEPVVVKRRDRLSPKAKALWDSQRPRACRPRSRHRHDIVSIGPRGYRDKDEVSAQRVRLYHAQGGRCAICGKPLPESIYEGSIDHVIPHALGGKDGYGNIVLAHRECNGEKTNDVPTGCEMVWLLMVNAKIGVTPVVF